MAGHSIVKRKKYLEEAKSRPPREEMEISIRDLLDLWGAKRRGYWVVHQVRQGLAEAGLTTEPDFANGWIDDRVMLKALPSTTVDHAEPGSVGINASPGSESQSTEANLMGGALTFADLDELLFEGERPPLVFVSESDPLPKAQSIMMRHDFSQLPVLNGPRTLKGAVSWESIAKAIAHRPATTVADCMVPADLLKLSDDVLTNVPKITQNGYILTKNQAQEVVGIVTTADLAAAFEVLSGPFLLLGICEQLLRNVAASNFEEDRIRTLRSGPPTERLVDALTLGELKALFDDDSNWDRLNWLGVDAATFRSALGEIVSLRNRVMHFRGERSWREDSTQVRNLIAWLRLLSE